MTSWFGQGEAAYQSLSSRSAPEPKNNSLSPLEEIKITWASNTAPSPSPQMEGEAEVFHKKLSWTSPETLKTWTGLHFSRKYVAGHSP